MNYLFAKLQNYDPSAFPRIFRDGDVCINLLLLSNYTYEFVHMYLDVVNTNQRTILVLCVGGVFDMLIRFG